jgi:MFS family permease
VVGRKKTSLARHRDPQGSVPVHRNIALYSWFQFAQNLLFWNGVWYLYFEAALSPPEAIALAAVFDLAVVLLEVPSGYFSDLFGRRRTLLVATLASATGCLLIWVGTGILLLAGAQVLLGAGRAFTSGTDNALLYESLAVEGREHEVAHQVARAWRYAFSGLAVSAAAGGALALFSYPLVFLLSGVAAGVAALIALQFREPPSPGRAAFAERPVEQLRLVFGRLQDRVLCWMFVFAAGTYAFSHVPWTFGQAWLKAMLAEHATGIETPLVSGLVTAAMMLVSVVTGWLALRLRARIGTVRVFLVASAIQFALITALALSVHPLVVLLLLMRMVPDAMTAPFEMEVIQPRLEARYRATYLSVKNLAGRLTFSLSLLVVAWAMPASNGADHQAISTVLLFYAIAALLFLVGLLTTARALSDRQ